jgi:hypothetical protein
MALAALAAEAVMAAEAATLIPLVALVSHPPEYFLTQVQLLEELQLAVMAVMAVLAVLAVLVVRHTNQATLQVLASVLVLPVEMASNRHHMNHHHQLVAVSMLYHLVKLPTTHLEPMPHGPDMVLM